MFWAIGLASIGFAAIGLPFERGGASVVGAAVALEAVVLVVIEVAALAQGCPFAAFFELHVVEFRLGLEGAAAGRLDAALLGQAWLASGQLVFSWHGAAAVAIPFFLFPAAPTDAQLLEQAGAELLELVLSALVDDDSVGATADDFAHRQLPGAEHPLAEQGHA